MAKLNSLTLLLFQEMKDFYHAENQRVTALPKMENAASDPALKNALITHLQDSSIHAERLEQPSVFLSASSSGKVCQSRNGWVEEGSQAIEEEGERYLRDRALTRAARRADYFEISGYGSARVLAVALNLPEVVPLLDSTVEQDVPKDRWRRVTPSGNTRSRAQWEV